MQEGDNVINSIEKKVSINSKCKVLSDKILLSNKNEYIISDVFVTLNNYIINQDKLRVVGNGFLVSHNKEYDMFVVNLFNDICKVMDKNGNILFEGRNLDVLTNKLFVRNANKRDIFGKLLNYKVLCDKKGNAISKKTYDAIYNYGDGNIITVNNKLYGVIDEYGNTIIKNKYRYISKFDNGIAIVLDNTGYRLVDKMGNIVSDRFDYIDKSNGMYKVCLNEKFGYIDRNGKFIIPCVYDYIGSYSDSLILIAKDEKYGYINKNNEVIVNPIYNYASLFYDGYALVNKVIDNCEKDYIIDELGNIVFEFDDDIVNVSWSFDDYLIATKVIDYDKDIVKLGFVDKVGNTKIPFMYDMVRSFKNGYAAFMLEDKWGVIDKDNNVVIQNIYDGISDFCDGYFIIKSKDMKRGLIDKNGKIILPCVFNNLVLLRNNNVYVDGYVYDIDNLSLSYNVVINLSEDPFVIMKKFNNENEMNKYYDLFNSEYDSFLEKVDLSKCKKLVKSK